MLISNKSFFVLILIDIKILIKDAVPFGLAMKSLRSTVHSVDWQLHAVFVSKHAMCWQSDWLRQMLPAQHA